MAAAGPALMLGDPLLVSKDAHTTGITGHRYYINPSVPQLEGEECDLGIFGGA